MAASTGSQAVQRGACTFQREMRCYSHRENSSNFTANLYLTSDGDVSYHSQQISTAWHGHWNLHHHDRKMVIQFSGEGDVTNLDTLVVFLCMGNADGTDEIWVGRDSRQKRITLRLLDQYRECTACRMWHIV